MTQVILLVFLTVDTKYILTYSANSGMKQYYVVGYKGTSYDGGMFYCAYIALQMVKSSWSRYIRFKNRFQNKIWFNCKHSAETGAISGVGAAVNDGGSAALTDTTKEYRLVT